MLKLVLREGVLAGLITRLIGTRKLATLQNKRWKLTVKATDLYKDRSDWERCTFHARKSLAFLLRQD